MNITMFDVCVCKKWLLLATLLSFFTTSVAAQNCDIDNVYLQAMPERMISISTSQQQDLQLMVKSALNRRTRAAGFQRVCESTIKAKPILFIFDVESIPRFHMRNVVAALDIAFIDTQGRVESIQSMQPYVLGSTMRPLYSPKRKVIAALETYKGFYQEHGIEVGSVVDWQLDSSENPQ